MSNDAPFGVTVEGSVDGDIYCSSVLIGVTARVRGNITADNLIIRGRVEGNIRARKLQLSATCHVEGDILHDRIEIIAGSFFQGNCRHRADPLHDAH
jgi:cytoskeletal protein CcmA (bactofilin family)